MKNNRLKNYFAEKSASHKTIIPYLTAGDPCPKQMVAVWEALVRGGADILEVGIPFSDPMADGETVQKAHQRALEKGITFVKVLELIAEFRRNNQKTPIVVMTYLNSLERQGFKKACEKMAEVGVDGVILVDCPVEALPDYQNDLVATGIIPILLATPTTSPERFAQISAESQAFIYYVSLLGVTGAKIADPQAVSAQVADLKSKTAVPICVGFGISDGLSARQMTQSADGVIIGSALIQALLKSEALPQTAERFISDIRHHLNEEQS